MSEKPFCWRAGCIGAAAFTVLVGACGGGNGTRMDRTNNAPPSGSAAITTDNAVAVMGEASASMMAIHMLGGLGGGMVSSAASGKSDPPRMMTASAVGIDTVRELSAMQNDPRVTLAALQSVPKALKSLDPVSCPDGGAITRTWDDINNDNKVNSGDTITLVFDSCVRGMSTRTGSISVSNFTLTGDPVANPTQPWQFAGELTLQDVAMTAADMNSRANGTLALDWRVGTQMMEQATARTVGPVTVAEGSRTFTYNDVIVTMSMDMSTGAMVSRMTADGNVNVTGLGDLELKTNTPMEMQQGGMQPASGSVTVTMGGSRVTATTVSPTAVELSVDSNGDGSVINVVNSSWDEIHPMPDMAPGSRGNGTKNGGAAGGGMMPRTP